ncbi:sigma factor-like helix-turn-helix DNA-binding protein [Streptomyces mirabilis]|uniref:sigma-70 region 4 domain-containing protein n=1 Tax=Streptomyces mirabilis TaxID=68239 RepID=UPI0036D863CA
MRSNTTGAVSTPAAVSTEGTDELPQDVQRDVDLVADLVAAGFTGPLWQQTADELYAYAFKPLLSAMRRTHKLADLCAKSATPLVITDEDRGTLYRSAPDRERLAILTISVAMETFPQVLKDAGYAPALNRGKDGRPTRLTSFFYGRCGLVFPRVLQNWRTEQTDRFVHHAVRMSDGTLLHALGQDSPETVPEGVVDLCDTLTTMINGLKPRNRAVWLLTVDGLSQGEIAEVLDIKVGDVENARYAFRSKVRQARRSGKLAIPSEIRSEWARTKTTKAVAR